MSTILKDARNKTPVIETRKTLNARGREIKWNTVTGRLIIDLLNKDSKGNYY